MSARLVTLDAFLLGELIDNARDRVDAEWAAAPEIRELMLGLPHLSFAMIDGPHVVAGGGLIPSHSGRACCWSLISQFARPRHVANGLRLLDAFVGIVEFRRVEAFVRAGAKWSCYLEHAGFVREGLMRAWDAAGRDHFIYARVKGA